MSVKTKKRTGWLRTWFSKAPGGRQQSAGRRLCKLRCEQLERRVLLSATVVAGAQTWLNVPVETTNGSTSGSVSGNSYYGTPQLSSATIDFSSPTSGTVNGNLNGPLTVSGNGVTLTATIAMTASASTTPGILNLSNGTLDVTAPSQLAGVLGGVTGTMYTSTGVTNISWSGGSSSWTGTVVTTDSTPFSVALTTPVWDSSADTQIDFGFTNPGTWSPTAAPATALDNIVAYWASGTSTSTEISQIGGATVPVYWNQASGAASIQGISSSTIPTGANYVLVGVEPQGSTSLTTFDSFKLVTPSFTLTGPTSGTFSAGQTVTFQWTAANVDAGSTISLAYDTTSTWGNPKYLEINGVTAADGPGTYSWTTTGIAAGTYYLDGYLYDAGQAYLSHTTSPITITVPSFTLTGPTSGKFTAGQAVTFQWTAANVDADSTITLAYDTTSTWGNPKYVEIDGVTAASGTGTYSWNTTGIAAGTYYLDGYLYDAGQAYLSHTTSPITVAAVTPSFTLTGPTSGTFTAGQAVTFQWTAANVDAGSTITLAYDTTSTWASPKYIEVDGVTAASGTGSYNWNTTGIAAGTYYLDGYLYDANQAYLSHTTSAITITSAAPSFTLTGPTSGTFTGGQTVTFQWTAANVASGSTITLAYDTTSTWGNPKYIEIDGVTAASGTGTYNWNTTGIAAGTYYLDGYLYDAGQAYLSHSTSPITIAAPSFTLTGPTSGTFTAGQTVTFQWTAASVTSGSTITLAYDTTSTWGNPKYLEIDGVTAANGTGTYNWNTTGLAAGTYYLDGYLYDAGQAYLSHTTSPITITSSVSGPPSFTLTGPTSGTLVSGQAVTIQWSAANVPSGSTISLAYDTTSTWTSPKWIEIDGVTAASGAGTYSWNTAGLAAGTYYLDGYMYNAGQAYLSNTASAITFIVPSFTLTGPASGTVTPGNPVSITWNASSVPSGSTISLAYDTTSTWGHPTWIEIDGVTAANGSGAYTWNTPTGLAPGTYFIDGYMYTPSSGTAFLSNVKTSFTVT